MRRSPSLLPRCDKARGRFATGTLGGQNTRQEVEARAFSFRVGILDQGGGTPETSFWKPFEPKRLRTEALQCK